MDTEALDNAAAGRYAERQQLKAALDESGLEAIIGSSGVDETAGRRELLHPNDGLGLERIIGESDLLEINFLDLGRRAARSIGRIQVRDLGGHVREFGTGFLVSPNLLLTNHHVLRAPDDARRSLVDFDYEDDESFMPKTPVVFGLDPDRLFLTDEGLDVTLVALQPVATDGRTPLMTYGRLPLPEQTAAVVAGEYVAVIQHPAGAPKRIALRNNKVVDVFDDFIHYTTDTEGGASGAPVFNDQWRVVALHHAGVRQRDAEGRVLAVDGSVWAPEMGEDRIAYVANEGVRISSIVRWLRDREDLSANQRALLDEVFAAQPVVRPADDAFIVESRDPAFLAAAGGYDPDFLDIRLEMPGLVDHVVPDIAPRNDGRGHVLDYTHFSVVMSRSRRLALLTAVNIDGRHALTIKRDRDVWFFDPRMETEFQTGQELYEGNDLDRGHLVRRQDPVWGSEAATANDDTFHLTNCAPQHRQLNRRTWLALEDYILKNAATHDLKVSVFTGPVFRADDMIYRGSYRLPAEFWKVVAIVGPGGKLSVTAYLQTQKNLIEDLEFAYGTYRTYQVPVSLVETIAGLDFGLPPGSDPLAPSPLESSPRGRVIGGAEDLILV